MRDALLVRQVKISGTKILCVLVTLLALTAAAFALVVMGYQWAKGSVVVTILAAVWVGFPSAVFGFFRKLADDRGRKGVYTYLNDDESVSNDQWYVVYSISTAVLVVAVLMIWLGYVNTFAFNRAAQDGFATSNTGCPLSRLEAADMAGFCVRLCLAASLAMAYLQRGKGRYLTGVSLGCGGALFILALLLHFTE